LPIPKTQNLAPVRASHHPQTNDSVRTRYLAVLRCEWLRFGCARGCFLWGWWGSLAFACDLLGTGKALVQGARGRLDSRRRRSGSQAGRWSRSSSRCRRGRGLLSRHGLRLWRGQSASARLPWLGRRRPSANRREVGARGDRLEALAHGLEFFGRQNELLLQGLHFVSRGHGIRL